MNVRRATSNDRDGVIRCARHYEIDPTDDAHVGQLFDLALDCDGMFVALDHGHVVGFLCSIVLPHPFSGRPYLDVVALFVQPSHRHTWAAGALVRQLLRFSVTLPLDMVKMAAPLNSSLGSILGRAGFVATELVFVRRP